MLVEPFNTTLFIHYKEPYSYFWMNIMNEFNNMIYYLEENYGFVNIGIIFLLSMRQKNIYNTTHFVTIAYFFVSAIRLLFIDMNETIMIRDINCYLYGQYFINQLLYIHYTELYGWNINSYFTNIMSFFTYFPISLQTFGLTFYEHEEHIKKDLTYKSNIYWYVEYLFFLNKLYKGTSFISTKKYSFLLEQYETSQEHSLLKLLCISLGYMTGLSIIKSNGFQYNQIIGFTWLCSRYLVPDQDVCNILIGLFCLYNFIIKRCGNNSFLYFGILFILVTIQLHWNDMPQYDYCQTIQDYVLHSLWIMPFEINSLINQLNIQKISSSFSNSVSF